MGSQEAKARLRRTVLARRDAIGPATQAARSRAIVEETVGLAAYRSSTAVPAHVAFGSEPETCAFLRHALDEGKALLLPRVNRQSGKPDVYKVGDPVRDLETGTWRIREPRPDRHEPADPQAAGLVLAPGIAFDRRGGRLGYRGGFYDRLSRGACRGTPGWSPPTGRRSSMRSPLTGTTCR